MNDLSTALHDWADRTDAGEAPVAKLIAAGSRRQARRRAAASSVGALTVAAVAGVALTTAAGGGRNPATRSPALDLAAAVTSTTGESFQFTIDATVTISSGPKQPWKVACTGAADPKANSGYLERDISGPSRAHLPSGQTLEVRLVNGDHYISAGKGWNFLGAGTVGDLRCGDSTHPADLATDPIEELQKLTQGVKVTKTANGYSFAGNGVRGTVTVKSGKVTKLSYDADFAKRGPLVAHTEHVITQLSGFGETVTVKKPV